MQDNAFDLAFSVSFYSMDVKFTAPFETKICTYSFTDFHQANEIKKFCLRGINRLNMMRE